MDFMRRAQRESHFVEHPAGLREITGLTLHTPSPLVSEASHIIEGKRVLSTRAASESVLEIEFDGNRGKRSHHFRPALPLIFHF
jgi:hypothetical protein